MLDGREGEAMHYFKELGRWNGRREPKEDRFGTFISRFEHVRLITRQPTNSSLTCRHFAPDVRPAAAVFNMRFGQRGGNPEAEAALLKWVEAFVETFQEGRKCLVNSLNRPKPPR